MNEKLNSKVLLQIVLASLIVYSTLTIIRSFGALYLAYSDSYFYNFNFELEQLREKKDIFVSVYYFVPYLLGLFLSLFLKKFLNIGWLFLLLSIILGAILFKLIDSSFIRPLFFLFETPRLNFIIHTIFFSLLLCIVVRYALKVKNKN